MACHEHGTASLSEVSQLVLQQLHAVGVETISGFIKDYDLRLVHECPSNCETLLHA